MRYPAVASLAFVLAACGGKTPPPDDRLAANLPDAGPRVIPPLPEGCPATYAEVGSGECDWEAVAGNCQYPEGQCYCGQPPVCSGAERDPNEFAHIPSTWQCSSWPPKVRADGCPGEIGGRCSDEGKECVYGSCCVATYRCERGEWQQIAAECPP